MKRIWFLGLAVVLITTACRIETNVLIDINTDETGSFGFEFGMDDEFRQLVSAQGGEFSIDDMFGGLGGELPGAEISERTEGDMMFTVVKIPFESRAQLQSLIAQGGDDGSEFDVTWTDDAITVVGLLAGSGEEGGLGGLGGLGDLGDAAGDLGGEFDLGDVSGFAEGFFSASVILSMPGDVSDHNADRVMGDGRLQWDIDLGGGDVDILAVSDLDGSTSFPAWAVVLLVLVAVAILLWLYSTTRRRKAVAAIEAAGSGSSGAQPAGDWSTGAAEAAADPGDEPSDAGPVVS